MEKIGQLNIRGSLVVIDPCYGQNDLTYSGEKLSPQQGLYNVYIPEGNVVSGIVMTTINPDKLYRCKAELLGRASVDSGTLMLSTFARFFQTRDEDNVNDDWYEDNVQTMDRFQFDGQDAVIVESGDGDGDYPIYTLTLNGVEVGYCVMFLKNFREDIGLRLELPHYW